MRAVPTAATAARIASTAVPAVNADPAPRFAGLCVPGQRARAADAMLLQVADRLAKAGHPAAELATHRVELDGGATLACSMRWADGAGDAIWPIVLATARAYNAAASLDTSGHAYGSADVVAAAQQAVAAARERREGRFVVFAGSRELVGTLPVVQLLERSAIETVSVLAAGAATGAELVHTRDFVRPILRNGRLDLLVQPAAGGVLVPFEVPNPTPCCAEHA